MSKIINDNLKIKYVQLYLMGTKMNDIANKLGIKISTAYSWKNREDIRTEIEIGKKELRDIGIELVKNRYLNDLNK